MAIDPVSGVKFNLNLHLDKIMHNMRKAGFPWSAVYLCMSNEANKYNQEFMTKYWYEEYQKALAEEEAEKVKAQQIEQAKSISYPLEMIANHFPADVAKKNAEAFVSSNPKYRSCPENAQAIFAFMSENAIPPTVEGFYQAFWKLYNAGVLLKRHDDVPSKDYSKQPAPQFSGYTAQQQASNSWVSGLNGSLGSVLGASEAFNNEALKQAAAQQKAQGITNEQIELQKQQNKIKADMLKQAFSDDSYAWGYNADSPKKVDKKPILMVQPTQWVKKEEKPEVDVVPDYGDARRFREDD